MTDGFGDSATPQFRQLLRKEAKLVVQSVCRIESAVVWVVHGFCLHLAKAQGSLWEGWHFLPALVVGIHQLSGWRVEVVVAPRAAGVEQHEAQ
jgi:hypothetical protein